MQHGKSLREIIEEKDLDGTIREYLKAGNMCNVDAAIANLAFGIITKKERERKAL